MFPFNYLSHIFLHKLRSNHTDETGVGPIRNGASTEGLACPGRTKEKHSFRGLNPKIDKALRLQGHGATKEVIPNCTKQILKTCHKDLSLSWWLAPTTSPQKPDKTLRQQHFHKPVNCQGTALFTEEKHKLKREPKIYGGV